MKLKIGQELMVISETHLEKTTITTKNGRIYTLANGIKVDSELTPLNSKLEVKVYNSEKYDELYVDRNLPRVISKLLSQLGKLSKEDKARLFKRINKLID